uniref:Fatty acid synthase n=1 Tax=Sipha flava TaxID=143950 RepID=A0A2S2QQD5_9HEMI
MEVKEENFEVVISGVGGKFPMSENMEHLRINLNNKVNMVTENDCRWNKDDWPGVPAATGKISVTQKLDDTFIGVNSRIIKAMDPLTRCLLERVYEAIMDAGLNPKYLYGSKSSVYTASCVSDSEAIGCDDKLTTPFWLLAHVRALLANRVSNLLNLQGPSYTIDSSWIGGIEILKQAADDVAKGRVETALVGVTNIIWHPDMAKHWIGLEKLSVDGICRSFDENASGYGRSEGVVVLLLQRSTEALRSYGTIVHVDARICMEKAVNLIRPSEDSIREFLKSFYENCKVSPASVSYLEADGSACKYYEEKELNVSSQIFCENQRTSPLPIGSIKSNLGHTEGASSLISVVKALITLDSGIIPPNINFQSPNNKIEALKNKTMKVVTEPTKLDGPIIATTTLGMPSSIGHVLLKQNPKTKEYSQLGPSQRLILLSSRTEKGISEAIDRVTSLPRDDEYLGLIQNVFKDNIVGHFHRGYAIVNSGSSPSIGLQEINEMNRPVWFVFAGMGSQWPGMASDLMEIPCFAESVKQCDKYLRPIGYDIVDIITNKDPEILKKKPTVAFLAIATIHIAFVDLLTKLGIRPDGMFGHSLGENGCSYADGCFNKYETLMAAYSRGKVSEFLMPEKGLMASVGLNYQNIPDLPPSIDIGCHNSENNVTLSGPAEDMEIYLETLKKQNIFVKTVNSNGIAYHSRMVRKQAEFVKKFIDKAVPNPKKRSSKWLSTSVPEENWNSDLAQWSSGQYHANNFKSTVYFSEICKKVPKNVIVIEIAPHGLFQGILKSSLDSSCKILSVSKRGSESPLKYFLKTLGELYSSGLQLDLSAIYPLPEFPVSRGTPSITPLIYWNHEETWPINTHYGSSKIDYKEVCLRDKTSRHLLGHKVHGEVVVPLSFIITEVLRTLEKKPSIFQGKQCQAVFENVFVHTPLISSAEESNGFYSHIQIGTGNFEVIENDNVLISGLIYMDDKNHLISPEPPTAYDVNIEDEWIPDNEVYRIFAENNIYFSNPYSTIQKILIHDKGLLANIIWNNDFNINLNSMMQLKMFSDVQSYHDLPLLPSWFRSLVIDKEKIKTITHGSMVYITFDTRTNVVRGPGVEIEILKNSVFPTICPAPINLNIQKVQFVDQSNPKIHNFTQFLSICLQLVKNTFQTSSKLRTKLKINDTKFIEPFQKVFEVQPFLKADVQEHSNVQITDLESNDTLLLVTEHLNEKLNKEIKMCAGRVFVLIKELIIDDNYTTVIQYEHNGSMYRLITRAMKLPNKILEVTTKNSAWKDNIEQGLKILTSNMSPIVLIKIDSDSCLQVVQEIENIKSPLGFRYVVQFDSAQPFDLTKTLFREQLFKGLRQNILKNNSWGNYNILPLNDKPSTGLDDIDLQKYIHNGSDLTIKYIESFKTDIMAEEVCTQYSGVDNEGRNVIGLSKFNIKTKLFEIDDILKWYVNSEFTLQEAAKFPLAYSMAYYCLVIKARVKTGDSVLIHDACSLDGQAFVRVAQSFNCNIYVTTYNNEQSEFLKSIFPKLNSGNILDINNNKFEVQLLSQTKEKGCDIVIHALPTEFLGASFQCVNKFGAFIHIGSQDVDVHTQIGTYSFLYNVTLYGVNDLLHVLNSSAEMKNHLKHLIENGIKAKTVCRLYDKATITSTSSTNVHSLEKRIIPIESNNLDPRFVKKDKSYVIIGSMTNLWINTVNWLLEQDAKKLIFIISGTAAVMKRSQKIIYSLIQKYCDVSFIMTSVERFNTIRNGENVLREFTSYTKIEAIFCVEMSDSKLKNIDSACRNVLPDLKHFICIQSDADGVCESRNNANSNCINLQCDKSIRKPEIILKYMNKLIESLEDSKPVTVVVSDSLKPKENLNTLSEYLPQTVDELLGLSVDLPEYPQFDKCVSKGLPNTDNDGGLLPVFIIPGLGLPQIEPFTKKIMHPVFCAKFPSYVDSVENAALGLLWPLKQIQSEGPYTIVGESWGGTIAVELAKIIEGFGETVNLLLLDGCPSDIKKRLQLLDNIDFELLSENSKKKEEINSSIDVLMNQLKALKKFIPNNTQLAANTIIARPSNSDVLDSCINFEKNHCGKLTVQISKKTSYNEFVNSLEAATIVNENASFKW